MPHPDRHRTQNHNACPGWGELGAPPYNLTSPPAVITSRPAPDLAQTCNCSLFKYFSMLDWSCLVQSSQQEGQKMVVCTHRFQYRLRKAEKSIWIQNSYAFDPGLACTRSHRVRGSAVSLSSTCFFFPFLSSFSFNLLPLLSLPPPPPPSSRDEWDVSFPRTSSCIPEIPPSLSTGNRRHCGPFFSPHTFSHGQDAGPQKNGILLMRCQSNCSAHDNVSITSARGWPISLAKKTPVFLISRRTDLWQSTSHMRNPHCKTKREVNLNVYVSILFRL